MNIIQSYWSAPSKNSGNTVFDRHSGGWLGEREHAISWSLSCLKLKQFYPYLQLFTDDNGSEWLIDKLNLPYAEVFNCLNHIPQLNPALWALAKLFVYNLQEKPFVHVDGDVYIWEAFKASYLKSELLAQNEEYDLDESPYGDIYISSAYKFLTSKTELPKEVKFYIAQCKESGRFYGYNTGVVGGYNLEFFREYTQSVFDYLHNNPQQVYEGKDMSFFEQFFFHSMASAKERKVSVLFEPQPAVSPTAYAEMMQFNLVPLKEKFIHVVGIGKRNRVPAAQVAMRLKYEFPKHYQHIVTLYPYKKFYFPAKTEVTEQLDSIFPYTLKLLQKNGSSIRYRSIQSFTKAVEKVIGEELQSTELQLLNDFFQIEYFRYKTPIYQSSEEAARPVLEKLYTLSQEGFMDLKMTFNSAAGRLVLMFYPFPTELTSASLLQHFDRVQNERAVEFPYMAILTYRSNEVEIEALNSWGALLSYFEGKSRSGWDLYNYLKSEKRLEGYAERYLKNQVLSFMTTYSVCYNYLVLTTQ
ncbi:hypothetical protein DYU05_06065 [Mucilaginibacter terrenus]|uniref:DUF6734 domain-containing protein n=1 Tax=Mucilaginibacter terrenus TaxID=2482727 RepID=A0A3E2NVX2_9SPHI|nr:DUF6734 family protein [Mucilaginibacter terrenus]RFZ85163.1 hypothetical protein DYU05_06065 [Mucilaginibacter terrenus]